MHHSASNDQFAFHTCLMAPETGYSSFTTGCAHNGQLIMNINSKLKIFMIASNICIVLCEISLAET